MDGRRRRCRNDILKFFPRLNYTDFIVASASEFSQLPPFRRRCRAVRHARRVIVKNETNGRAALLFPASLPPEVYREA